MTDRRAEAARQPDPDPSTPQAIEIHGKRWRARFPARDLARVSITALGLACFATLKALGASGWAVALITAGALVVTLGAILWGHRAP